EAGFGLDLHSVFIPIPQSGRGNPIATKIRKTNVWFLCTNVARAFSPTLLQQWCELRTADPLLKGSLSRVAGSGFQTELSNLSHFHQPIPSLPVLAQMLHDSLTILRGDL